MAKINKDEYEILQFLNNTKDWIVRNPDSKLWAVEGEAPRKAPFYETWKEGDGQDTSKVDVSSFLFKFIQWENKEPYNIQELIDEYESEETEVKDIEWLKETLEERIDTMASFEDASYSIGLKESYQQTLLLIDQLDEPEVLSQGWVEENTEYADAISESSYKDVAVVRIDKLQNLLVPKQESLVVPAWFDEWFVVDMMRNKKLAAYHISRVGYGHGLEADGVDRTSDVNTNKMKYITAILNGYTVEEGQKYVIKLEDESYLQRYEIDDKNIVSPFRIIGHLKKDAIKFNNKKKAEKVAELVEGKVERAD